jgi:RNA polymerase sigma-70 factor (ECF subfamily)
LKTIARRIEIERVLAAMEPRLRGFALRCLGRAADADDVVQEVAARVLAGADGFRGDAAPATWIRGIAARVVADWVRSPFRRRSRPLRDGPAAEPGPAEEAHRAEERERVRRAVGALPVAQRLVLVLREYEGLRYREIAAALGVPIGTVESRLHAARRRLAKELAP